MESQSKTTSTPLRRGRELRERALSTPWLYKSMAPVQAIDSGREREGSNTFLSIDAARELIGLTGQLTAEEEEAELKWLIANDEHEPWVGLDKAEERPVSSASSRDPFASDSDEEPSPAPSPSKPSPAAPQTEEAMKKRKLIFPVCKPESSEQLQEPSAKRAKFEEQ